MLGAIVAVRTVMNSGPAALAQMDDGERVLLARLGTIRKGLVADPSESHTWRTR